MTEKRLIDANEAYEIARTSGLHDDFGRCMADLTSLKELLEDVPTVDAVEVVRCKDCKHYHEETGFCEEHSCFCKEDMEWNMFAEDDFCSYGERRIHESYLMS
jgi:hypothetical protein